MPRPLEDVIDDIGFGLCQWRLIILGGGIWFVGGELATLVFLIPGAIAQDLGLGPYQRGSLVSVFVIGNLLGSVANFLSDRYLGRRQPILLCYAQLMVFAIAATFVQNFWLMLLCLMGIGFSLGFGVPAWNSLCTEACPPQWRLFMNGISQALWNVATVSVLFTVMYYSPSLTNLSAHWRKIILAFRVPNAVLLGLGLWPGFVSSARWYHMRGEKDTAQEVLDQMRQQNSRPYVEIDLVHAPAATPQHMQKLPCVAEMEILAGGHLRCTTLVCMLSAFTITFVSSGTSYAFPILAPQLSLGVGPAAFLIVSSFFEVAGIVVAMYTTITRKQMISIYLVGTSVSLLAFIGSVTLRNHALEFSSALMPVGLLTCNFFVSIGWIVVYTYVGEAFPTKCRSTAAGVIMATGRLGGIVSPLVFEHLYSSGIYFPFFLLDCLLIVGNAVAVTLYLPETKSQSLEDVEAEARPLNGSPGEKIRAI